ncbi:hypothetical protein [Corynebacterium liangguodongii]|uniref:Uncharacterized protein n=1 Tax=Corynebacterium liangguodongii TaxID=2079535 RepID=A0A2S0WFR0_9CORY|nr:hypothetical protein [Corynebacterium liangguodongii]AWB84623.1 hypothetical protein C3E79_09175 [Corynebacterium liangguodongii]PWB99631.1 hypothetical protein DF219_04955 [Corynebacterium liangguodongii]
MRSKNLCITLAALMFSFLFFSIRDWAATGRTFIDTFSEWQYAAQFLIFWLAGFAAALVVFFGIDYLATRNRDTRT